MTTSTINSLKEGFKLRAESAVELRGIGKKYPRTNKSAQGRGLAQEGFWALRDFSLDVGRGEVLGVIGRNGSGKTTLLNIIAGILSPTQGKICVKGRVLGLFNLGTGFQDELTGRENIFLNGALLGAGKKELNNKLGPIIDFSELGEFIDMPMGSYSQGMRLRLGFSIIANLEFDILAIDEILAVGDILFQSKCFQRLADLRRAGKTLILASQSMDLMQRLCNKVALLDHGRIVFHGEAAEGINKYRVLLNTQRFFVGPAPKERCLVENTKKWVDDICEWDKKLGAKEIEIESVKFINRFGFRSRRGKSGQPLKIKVNFRAKEDIYDPHFGVAIFRDDGVYCYGPNTRFDGYENIKVRKGRGHFTLKYHNLLLAPGEYRVSVAIWDKSESLAYDYHSGYYKLAVKGGQNYANELLKIPFTIDSRKKVSFIPGPGLLEGNWGKRLEAEGLNVESVELLDSQDKRSLAFFTNSPVKFNIKFSGGRIFDPGLYLYLGLYRDDRICCQSMASGLKQDTKIIFPVMALLPGGYKISVGVWDDSRKKFPLLHHGIYPLRMVFDRNDHGTVFLRHSWKWKGAKK